MTALAPDRTLDRIKRHLHNLGASALASYKATYFDRRVRSRMRIRGIADAATYADLLDRDESEGHQLLSALAIGVTSFFRNPSAWRQLAAEVAECEAEPLRAWSAGCSTGEEAYSLAMLLASRTRGAGWSVCGTDIDGRSLERAVTGDYPGRAAEDLAPLADCLTATGALAGDRFRIAATVRAGVTFFREDLLTAAPRDQFQLVVCRNLLIYLDQAAQRRAVEQLLAGLAPGGLLFLGQADFLPSGFPELELVDRAERLYRRAAR